MFHYFDGFLTNSTRSHYVRGVAATVKAFSTVLSTEFVNIAVWLRRACSLGATAAATAPFRARGHMVWRLSSNGDSPLRV
jgi:hypothetical protein